MPEHVLSQSYTLYSSRTCPKSDLSSFKVTGLAINQFYFPPKSLDLFQMKCNPLQMARTCTKSVLTPLECPDVSKINSYPLSSIEPILVSSTPLPLKFFWSVFTTSKMPGHVKKQFIPFQCVRTFLKPFRGLLQSARICPQSTQAPFKKPGLVPNRF